MLVRTFFSAPYCGVMSESETRPEGRAERLQFQLQSYQGPGPSPFLGSFLCFSNADNNPCTLLAVGSDEMVPVCPVSMKTSCTKKHSVSFL